MSTHGRQEFWETDLDRRENLKVTRLEDILREVRSLSILVGPSLQSLGVLMGFLMLDSGLGPFASMSGHQFLP